MPGWHGRSTAGRGVPDPLLRDRVATLGLTDCVDFVGMVDNERMLRARSQPRVPSCCSPGRRMRRPSSRRRWRRESPWWPAASAAWPRWWTTVRRGFLVESEDEAARWPTGSRGSWMTNPWAGGWAVGPMRSPRRVRARRDRRADRPGISDSSELGGRHVHRASAAVESARGGQGDGRPDPVLPSGFPRSRDGATPDGSRS